MIKLAALGFNPIRQRFDHIFIYILNNYMSALPEAKLTKEPSMSYQPEASSRDFDTHFKIFHELMSRKVRDILLVSTPYDAWIMERDYSLSDRIINEYRGLNLSQPPRLTWAATAEEALTAVEQKTFDLVITMPRLADMDAFHLAKEIKVRGPRLPVIMLTHSSIPSSEIFYTESRKSGIDRIFVWSGSTDLLLAIIKSTEDRLNVVNDTKFAGIRVIIFVEDSPLYLSSLLPILYKELVRQTQAVMEEGLNEEHRLLTMRARPKILVAENYDQAMSIYNKYENYVLGVISDVRYQRRGEIDGQAGIKLLTAIKKDHFDIPLLLASTEPENAAKAEQIPASFVDKNSPTLHQEVHDFFINKLGFGDFVFRMPDGTEIRRAHNLLTLERHLANIPEESVKLHTRRNDLSRWLFTRTEIVLASKVRPIRGKDFEDVEAHRQHLISLIRSRRRQRQKGIVVNFNAQEFDPDTDFLKIGKGSLGGKGRGLAFVSHYLNQNQELYAKYPGVKIMVPQTLIVTTEGFEAFIVENDLRWLAKADLPDRDIGDSFLKGQFPLWLEDDLRSYLEHIHYPLAIRSSSLLEDAQFKAYAGLYLTYMLPNNSPDLETRLTQLIKAVKLVYASTYFQAPKSFSRRVGQRTEEEQMAVIIQQLVGQTYGDCFFPAISGVGQSYNYYPFSRMKPEDGIVTIAAGLGKMVVEGEKSLRFSPKNPQILPQRSRVEDTLENSQRYYYCLNMDPAEQSLEPDESFNLNKADLFDLKEKKALSLLFSTYNPDEHRIRDSLQPKGYPVLTFARILKYNQFPLAPIMADLLHLGQKGMGSPVEMEFSVNLPQKQDQPPEFAFLQLRPMSARAEMIEVQISPEEISKSFCFSTNALGNAVKDDLKDIIFIKPETFDPAKTVDMAGEIGKLNKTLLQEGSKYLLIGPGRWGSADPWLGIPVHWSDISGVGAIVEVFSDQINAEPSQGSHFFHNITTLGIHYINVNAKGEDFLDWGWLNSQPVVNQTGHAVHVRLESPLIIKVDGKTSRSVMYAD